VKTSTIGIRTLADYSICLKDRQLGLHERSRLLDAVACLVAAKRLVGAEGLAADGAHELRVGGQGLSRRRRLLHTAVTATGEHQEAERDILLLGALAARVLPLGYLRLPMVVAVVLGGGGGSPLRAEAVPCANRRFSPGHEG
jgi:hypothetical protein